MANGQTNKIVVFDFDGPINSETLGCTATPILAFERLPNNQGGCSPIHISNKDFLAITLKILDDNQVKTILGSQRIQMGNNGSAYEKAQKARMFKALNLVFGNKRNVLTEEDADAIADTLPRDTESKEIETNTSKNSILDAVTKQYSIVDKSNIILIDDSVCYQKPAEDAGYGFIHAPRTASLFEDDQAYLFEALVRTIPLTQITKSLKNLKSEDADENNATAAIASDNSLNLFQRCFFNYLLKNATQVRNYQVQLRIQTTLPKQKTPLRSLSLVTTRSKCSEEKNTQPNPKESCSKEFLLSIKAIIENINWTVKTFLFFGGKSITKEDGKSKTVPDHVYKIHQLINNSIEQENLEACCNEIFNKVVEIGDKAATSSNSNRDTKTQEFYDMIQAAGKSRSTSSPSA